MYLPAAFALTDPHALAQLITAYPLGTLIDRAGDGLEAEHLPFEYQPDTDGLGTLRAHVARANALCVRGAGGPEVLVVFRGEQAYVSPSWYPSKHEAHRQVPTWNYEAVHVRGRLVLRDDERFLRGLLARLTRQHEASQAHPWKMGDAPADYLSDMLSKIVGVEIAITSVEGKAKLSQNKEVRDRWGVIAALEAQGHTVMAQHMRRDLD